MIRWRYVIPRLLILVVVGLFLRFGLSPVLRWSLVSIGESVTQAKVEIGQLEAGIFPLEIRLADVQLADP